MEWWQWIMLILLLGLSGGYVYWKFFMPKGGATAPRTGAARGPARGGRGSGGRLIK